MRKGRFPWNYRSCTGGALFDRASALIIGILGKEERKGKSEKKSKLATGGGGLEEEILTSWKIRDPSGKATEKKFKKHLAKDVDLRNKPLQKKTQKKNNPYQSLLWRGSEKKEDKQEGGKEIKKGERRGKEGEGRTTCQSTYERICKEAEV